MSNGGGGAGLVEGVGFGYDPDGGTDYVPPRNSEGEMNLFRVEVTKHNEIDTSEEGTFKITYNVADANGNTATVVRTIEVVPEITTPVLTLVGEVAVTSEAGSVYETLVPLLQNPMVKHLMRARLLLAGSQMQTAYQVFIWSPTISRTKG